MTVPITPLHVRSGYSMLRGPAGLERLIQRAAGLGHAAVALADVNGLYGAPMFCEHARESGLKPIIGAELQEADCAIVALVASETGYENLCRIITRIHWRSEASEREPTGSESLVADLAELADGLEVIVEDGAAARLLVGAGVKPWLGIDPPTQGHGRLRRLIECGRELSLATVATGKALLTERGELEVARLLTAIRLGSTYGQVTAESLPNPLAVLRGPAKLARQLADFPAAAANNHRLAERCSHFELLGRGPVFPSFAAPGGQSAAAYLRRLCREGLRRRYGRISHTAEARLNEELALIERKGFAEYFLVVWDIVRYARGRGAPVAGRGSGASSLVAYALGITNVCPLTYDIPFERFLNERREDFPDLDVDFCWRIRDDVIDYVFRRWGTDRVAMVSAHIAFQDRSGFRETAKAFGLSDRQISRFLRAGPAPPDGGKATRILELDEAESARLLRLSGRIRRLPRNLSVHPGGVVIVPRAIDRYVPIQRAAKGVMVTQYDKDGVEAVGLVKLDLLGNRNLSTVGAACELIRRRRGVAIDPESLPPADPATVAALRSADTVGCNQLESPAMRHLLKMLAPAGVGDVIKALALIRPGAASIGMKEVFVRRHRHLEPVPRGHRQVDAVLRDSYGVMLYEDDVMLTVAAMLNVTAAEADPFRRAIQKCRDDGQRRRLSGEFVGRCAAAGVDRDYAASMWVQMAKFNAYSFCRAHAASYAVLAYAGAYLKTHYPLEFWTAALNNNQSMYHPRVYVAQAKGDAVRFLLPDVNRSGAEFGIDDGCIRVGLGCVAGLGPAAVEAILRARKDGPFVSVGDAVARAGLATEQARALILCGAFDFTARHRPALMMELALADRARSAGPVRGRSLIPAAPTLPEGISDYSPARKYADQWRILGISTGEHPLARWRRGGLGRAVDTDSRQLARRIGRRVRIAGMLEARRTTTTQKGRTMTFLTLHDEYGLFEVTVFPTARLARAGRGGSNHYGPYIVTGKVQGQYGTIAISAGSVSLWRPKVQRAS